MLLTITPGLRGDTPLYWAVAYDDRRAAELLLQKGAAEEQQVNVIAEDGLTAAGRAAVERRFESSEGPLPAG